MRAVDATPQLLLSMALIAPASAAAFALFVQQSVWLALFLVHGVFISLPAVYLLAYASSEDLQSYQRYFKTYFSRPQTKRQICSWSSLLLLLLGMPWPGLGIGTFRCPPSPAHYSFFQEPLCTVPADSRLRLAAVGLDLPLLSLLGLGLYFTIVNPILEEFFWRIFLFRESFARLWPADPDDPLYTPEGDPHVKDLVVPSFGLRESLGLSPDFESLRSLLPDHPGHRMSLKGTLAASCVFASYHFPIIAAMFGPLTAAGATFFLSTQGFVMQRIFESKEGGLVGSTVYHIGLDVGAAAVIGVYIIAN